MKPFLQILLFSLLAFLNTPAIAQDDPRQILQDSAITLKTTPGFTAKVTLAGEGSQMILSTMPSMTARINMGNHPDFGNALHLIGELRPTKAAPPESFDLVYTFDKYIWADHAKQTINIRPPSVSARVRPPAYSYILLAELIKDDPFQKELDSADSFELEAQQTIGNTNCNVVLITRAKPKKGTRAGGHNKERWFIAADDKLPRRVEQITDAGMIRATLIMELTNLTIAPQPDTDLDVYRPETYKVSDTTKKPAPKAPTIPDANQSFAKPQPRNTTQTRSTPPPSTDPLAPNYTFTDTTGDTVTRATQQGRITALYFFGSWSIPSKHTTPLLSTLAAEFDTQIDTFAIALREADPQSIKDAHTNNAYAHRLAINPPTTLANLFKARVYPTLIVIDDTDRIIYKEHLTDDRTPQQLIDQARAAITKALGN